MFPVLLFIIDSHGGPWRIIMSNLHGKLIDTGGQIPQNLLSPGKMMSGMLLSEVTQIGSVICNNHMSCTNDKYLFKYNNASIDASMTASIKNIL